MKIVKLIILIICILNLAGCIFKLKTDEYIKKEINVDISSCTIEVDNNEHLGFQGDGEYLVKANCKNNKDKILNQLNKWKRLPLSENLQLIMYGGERNEITYGYELAKKNGIPEIKNGYYYFINRFRESTNKTTDENLFNGYSFNFTIAFYDEDTNMFYYYEFDT